MAQIEIDTVADTDDRSLPVFTEMNQWMERVRERAFDLFAERGFQDGRDLEDWLLAESQVCSSAAELIERDDDFVLTVALAGFSRADVKITASPREIVIKASRKKKSSQNDKDKVHWSEFHTAEVYRRVSLPGAIRVDDISTKFSNGMLTINTPKAVEKDTKVSSAA